MPPAHEPEVRGDWNDLKGAYYHFIYALWSLLCERDRRVSFYQGNDLHLAVTIPPRLANANTSLPVIGLCALPSDDDLDIWVQLKATTKTWTGASLFAEADNIVVNFLCNALTSRRAGRQYRVRLVTQAAVKSLELTALIAHLDDHRLTNPSLTALNKAIKRVRNRYIDAGEPVPDETELKALAREILDQLRGTEPISLRLLAAEIERELYRLYPDLQTVRFITDRLLGAMFNEAGRGPGEARPLDREWVENTGVPPLFNRGVLDEDAVRACSEMVRDAAPRGWDSSLCTPRADLHSFLDLFVSAPQTLCVVVGPTGYGVTWSVYNWAKHHFNGHLRLFLADDLLTAETQLTTLLSRELRRTTTAHWAPETFLHRLTAASYAGRGPLVLILDGVPAPPSDEQGRVARALARLVTDCKQAHVKLVLTCHTDVWARSPLSDHIVMTDLFHNPDTPPRAGEQVASYSLGALSDGQVGDIVRRRLDPKAAAVIAPYLITPAFGALRSPYLLTLYLQRNREVLHLEGAEPPPGVDELLDDRVAQSLGRVARLIRRDIADVRLAFDTLIDRMWEARRSTLDNRAAVLALDNPLPGLGNTVFTALNDEGLLAATSPIALVEPAVAARCFARALLYHGLDDKALGALSPDHDGPVVVALLRGAPDPIPDAERLLASDEQWLGPVGDGLTQWPRNDIRIVALLAVLTRPDPGAHAFTRPAVCWALGELASRNERAFHWVQDMYEGDREIERYRGGEALAATMNLAPIRVGEIVRERLGQLADELPPGTLSSRPDHALDAALMPLRHVPHPKAAHVAHEIITFFHEVLSRGAAAQQTTDTIRGTLALHLGDAAIDLILTELHAPQATIREHAARALRPVAFERPDKVSDALAEALEHEREPAVIRVLLWAAYPVGIRVPDLLLDALISSPATQWTSAASATTAALTLFLLGSLAGVRPQRVVAMLPRHFAAYSSTERAVLAEALVYAWWCCSEHDDGAGRQVDALRRTALDDVPDDYHAFALRGSIMAYLGGMFPAGGYADELRDKPTALGGIETGLFIVNIDEFTRRHGDELATHTDTRRLEDLLLSCIKAADATEAAVDFGDYHNALFSCATSCLELYVRLAVHRTDPMQALHALPQEWQALWATRRVLAEGSVSQPIIEYAHALCDRFMNGGSAHSAAERRYLLAALAADHIQTLPDAQQHPPPLSLHSAGIGGHNLGFEFAASVNAHPDEALHRLDSAIRSDNDLPILYYWADEARTWATLLIARLYTRMFDKRAIAPSEARDLCTDVQAALTAWPDAPLRHDYALIYGAILTALEGHLPTAVSVDQPTSRIGQSHAFAAQLLVEGWQHTDPAEWLHDTAADPRGLLESADYSASDGSLASHYSRIPQYLYCALPAVRLALVAVAHHHGHSDPVATFMRERGEADKILSDLGWIHDTTEIPTELLLVEIPTTLDSAAESLEKHVKLLPRDERLWNERGFLALRRGDLPIAEQSFAHCLHLLATPTALPSMQALRDGVLYNQACVFARTGHPDKCQQNLDDLSRRGMLDCDWAKEDPDLDNVRSCSWFQELCG